jgi:hypothetical protein
VSNEVNIAEVARGILDPGDQIELYHWNINSNKLRFFTVVPDAWIPIGDVGKILVEPDKIDFEITRVWSTLWVSREGRLTYQWNVTVRNVGGSTAAFRLLMAETDN